MRQSIAPIAMLLLTPSLAAAQGKGACLTQAEADGLVRFALPDVVGQLSKACATSLPATAYLIRARADLVAGYSAAAAPAAPAARAALSKIAGLNPVQAETMRDETVRDLLSLGIAEAMGGKLKAQDCAIVDAVLEQLAPLPAENVARLIGIAMAEGGKPKAGEAQKNNPLRICGGDGGV